MRIRTQFFITMAIFGALICGILISVIFIYRDIDRSHQQREISANIAQGASELSYLANDYVIYREPQQLERWQARFTSFSNDIARLGAEGPEQQALVEKLEANAQRLYDVFESIVFTLEDIPQPGPVSPSLIQISWSRMAVQSQALVSDATLLSQMLDEEADRLQFISLISIIAMILIFGAYYAVIYLSIQRRTLGSLAVLQAGTEKIGSGNLDFTIEEKKNDEMGDLSRAFNRMALDLKAVTASKTDLEREIEERKQAEAALRRSEEKYRTLFSSMSEGFALHEIILDAESKPCDYRFLEINDAFSRLTGLNREQAIGKTVKELLPGVEPYWIEKYGKVAITGEPIRFENYSASLHRWYGTFAFSPVRGQFAVLFTDITERKKNEEALREARENLEIRIQERTGELKEVNEKLNLEIEEHKRSRKMVEIERKRFDDVLENLPIYVILLTPDYHVAFANRFFRERFGADDGKPCYEYLFGRSVPCEKCDTYKVLQTNRPHHWEWLGPDGRNYEIFDFPFTDVDGSPLILEVGIDISEQKIAQSELRRARDELEKRVEERTAELSETRDYLDNLFNYANAPIIVWNPGFEITRFNHAFERITGLNADSVIGKKIDILFPEESRDESLRHIHEATYGERWETVEIPIKHQNGSVNVLLWNSANIYEPEGGTVIATIAQGQDITERKKAEEELKRSNAELEAANKELEAFSYSVSHDLRAPLRSMEGFSAALLEDYYEQLDERGRKYLKYIQDSSDLMARIIDDLLKLSRVTRTDMNYEKVNLSAMAREILTGLQKTEPHRKVKLEIAPDLIAYGDRNLLHLALENLLGNAWKFTGKTTAPVIEVGRTKYNNQQAFFIRDNGVGFDMNYVDKLFKPFQRLHKAHEFAGTGIGLATVQRIVRRHGGEVWAESKLGEGTAFYFTLNWRKGVANGM